MGAVRTEGHRESGRFASQVELLRGDLKASGLGGLGNGGRMILQLRSSRESTQGFQIVRTLPGSIRPTKAGPGLRLPWIGGFRNLREEIMATGPLRIDQFVLVRAHLPVRRFGNPVVAPGR